MIPFVDLKREFAPLEHDIDAAIRRVVDSCAFAQGPELDRFEEEFAAYVGVKHCIGVDNGTDALVLALAALGVGAGDEVIVPANTFIATAFAVTANGATPVLADVDPASLLMTAEIVEPLISPRTRAIVPVHLFGQLCEMAPLLALAGERNIPIVEDAAQAHGARTGGRRAGSFGEAGCFSFYPTKNLGAFGNGGAVVTDRDDLARALRRKRWLGQDRTQRYVHHEDGANSILDSLQAAVLRVKLAHLDEYNERRRAVARRYRAALEGVVELTSWRGDDSHVFHLFVALFDDRRAAIERFEREGIGYGIHYPVPLHRQPALAHLDHGGRTFPVTDRAAERMLSLPMCSRIPEREIDAVVDAVRAAAGTRSRMTIPTA